jgi:hypothetical protein
VAQERQRMAVRAALAAMQASGRAVIAQLHQVLGLLRPARPVGRAGHGLLGMRERTTLHGGALETG